MRHRFAVALRALAARLEPTVPTQPTLVSTQFAGSGLVVNQYGIDLTDLTSMKEAALWAIKRRPGGSI